MKNIPVFNGKILKDYSLELLNRDAFMRYLTTFEPESEIDVIVRKKTRQRSMPQNDYYWGVIISMICEETGSDRDSVHEFCRRAFLRKSNGAITVADFHDVALDPKDSVPSTTELTTSQFSEYHESIKRWAAQFLSIFIPDPNEQVMT